MTFSLSRNLFDHREGGPPNRPETLELSLIVLNDRPPVFALGLGEGLD